jgi:hypothetical protein
MERRKDKIRLMESQHTALSSHAKHKATLGAMSKA